MRLSRKVLYFISSKGELEKSILVPSIPDNFLTRGKFCDWQTQRIRLYESPGDGLSAGWIGENLTGGEFYVYRAKNIRSESLLKPTVSEVPYALLVPEWWYLGNLYLENLGKIKVTGEGEKRLYHYGKRSTKAWIRTWKWQEILKPWEKSKLLPSMDKA